MKNNTHLKVDNVKIFLIFTKKFKMTHYKRISGIYCILNTVNNKRYIGYSTNIKKRWNDGHRYYLRRGQHLNCHIQKAWSKYGENVFEFSILEVLPSDLTKQEYEAIETKWVLHFKSHLSHFGYNSVLPGTVPLVGEDVNTTKRDDIPKLMYICINTYTKEVVECNGPVRVNELTEIAVNHVAELSTYWERMEDGIPHNGRKKSRNGWIVVKKEFHNPDFDYINYKKPRMFKDGVKKTWKDYYRKEDHRKNPEDIIPAHERQLKRVSIIATNIETGEEREFPMIKSCSPEFSIMKIYKCINNPFKKYKHRGHYFRKADTGGCSVTPTPSLSSSF